jgi:hypothetical protein
MIPKAVHWCNEEEDRRPVYALYSFGVCDFVDRPLGGRAPSTKESPDRQLRIGFF